MEKEEAKKLIIILFTILFIFSLGVVFICQYEPLIEHLNLYIRKELTLGDLMLYIIGISGIFLGYLGVRGYIESKYATPNIHERDIEFSEEIISLEKREIIKIEEFKQRDKKTFYKLHLNKDGIYTIDQEYYNLYVSDGYNIVNVYEHQIVCYIKGPIITKKRLQKYFEYKEGFVKKKEYRKKNLSHEFYFSDEWKNKEKSSIVDYYANHNFCYEHETY